MKTLAGWDTHFTLVRSTVLVVSHSNVVAYRSYMYRCAFPILLPYTRPGRRAVSYMYISITFSSICSVITLNDVHCISNRIPLALLSRHISFVPFGFHATDTGSSASQGHLFFLLRGALASTLSGTVLVFAFASPQQRTT